MKELLFGTAGIPLSTKAQGTIEGIKQVRILGLDAMELEFVQNVNISEKMITEVRKTAEQENVVLTCHGQYYVNLASPEKAKVEASKKRMWLAAKTAADCGCWSVVWHMAFYQGQPKEKVFEQVKTVVKELVKKLKDYGSKVWVRPETTGKQSQWGDLNECIRLAQEVEQVLPCIDFAHMHAREGKNNSFDDFKNNLALVEKGLGKEALQNMHCHVSGINYTEKGERNHLNLPQSDLKYKELLKALKEFKAKGVIISESPNIEGDALMMKREWEIIS
ncbi:MAG: TIM barrel protein [Candidatus Woesearchaeota archaeon]